MSKKQNLYLGKAGQFAIMSGFLTKGWNVAIPEVDIGNDIFVVRNKDGNFKWGTSQNIIRKEDPIWFYNTV